MVSDVSLLSVQKAHGLLHSTLPGLQVRKNHDRLEPNKGRTLSLQAHHLDLSRAAAVPLGMAFICHQYSLLALGFHILCFLRCLTPAFVLTPQLTPGPFSLLCREGAG